VVGSAPRVPCPLVDELRRLAASTLSVAEICREAGRFSASRGFQRPSYETVRRLVERERELRALPSVVDPLLDGWLRARSPENAVDEAFRRAEHRAAARGRIESERTRRPRGGGAVEPNPAKPAK
jgi:hypothetical protein